MPVPAARTHHFPMNTLTPLWIFTLGLILIRRTFSWLQLHPNHELCYPGSLGVSNQWGKKIKIRLCLALVSGAVSSWFELIFPPAGSYPQQCLLSSRAALSCTISKPSTLTKEKREHELAEIKDLGQIALLDKAPLL